MSSSVADSPDNINGKVFVSFSISLFSCSCSLFFKVSCHGMQENTADITTDSSHQFNKIIWGFVHGERNDPILRTEVVRLAIRSRWYRREKMKKSNTHWKVLHLWSALAQRSRLLGRWADGSFRIELAKQSLRSSSSRLTQCTMKQPSLYLRGCR